MGSKVFVPRRNWRFVRACARATSLKRLHPRWKWRRSTRSVTFTQRNGADTGVSTRLKRWHLREKHSRRRSAPQARVQSHDLSGEHLDLPGGSENAQHCFFQVRFRVSRPRPENGTSPPLKRTSFGYASTIPQAPCTTSLRSPARRRISFAKSSNSCFRSGGKC